MSKIRLRMKNPNIGNTSRGFLPKLSERGPANKVKTTEGSLWRNPLFAWNQRHSNLRDKNQTIKYLWLPAPQKHTLESWSAIPYCHSGLRRSLHCTAGWPAEHCTWLDCSLPHSSHLACLLNVQLLGGDVTQEDNDEGDEGKGLNGDIIPYMSHLSDDRSTNILHSIRT